MIKRNELYYALFGNCCCFCPRGSDARVYTSKSPMGPFIIQGNINRDDKGEIIIPAQQTHVASIPTADGTRYIWMGDLWGSRPDGIKGHDIQYWSDPLKFNKDGTIQKLEKENSWYIELTLP